MKEAIIKIVEEGARVKVAFFKENTDRIVEVVHLIAQAFRDGKKVLLFGNGGSSTDACHIAAEFVNRFLIDRPPLPAIALNTDPAVLTSISNDFGYDQIFSKQLRALGHEGDVVIALSTSGNSPNVVRALKAAKRKSIRTIAFTGKNRRCKATGEADEILFVDSDDTPRIQEAHLVVGHIICDLVEMKFASKKH